MTTRNGSHHGHDAGGAAVGSRGSLLELRDVADAVARATPMRAELGIASGV